MDMSDPSSDSSSSDEVDHVPRPKQFRNRMNIFEMFDEREFQSTYRLSKLTIMSLLEMFGREIEPRTKRNKPVSALDQILITLHYYATGAFQQTVADHLLVHKTTVCRIIKKVTNHLAALRRQYIIMPKSEEERNILKQQFYNIQKFPYVIGLLDCTHIKIQSPGGPDAEMFRNRKGYFSLNVQAVCDAKLNIRDIVARWPGSVHDGRIFNDSHLRAEFEHNVYGNDLLLGDSGYPCQRYLLTPFMNPQTPSEEAYNSSHIATRKTIERCFGLLKRRFPCLSMGLRVQLDTQMGIIVACAVLHNIALTNNDSMDDLKEEFPINEDIVSQGLPDINVAVRNSLLAAHFDR